MVFSSCIRAYVDFICSPVGSFVAVGIVLLDM